MLSTLTIAYDDEILLSAGMSPEEFAAGMKFTMAARLYEEGKLTAGQAARLCGRGKVDFLYELPKHGYPMINLGDADLLEDLDFARGK